MTRDEALTEWVVPAIRRTWNEKKCAEILKALEQEPCADCISRQAVLSHKVYTETEEGWSGYTVNADIIEQLPSVQPKQTECEDCISKQAVIDFITEH